MTPLATRLGATRHTSVLLRRARALGLADLSDLIRLAVQRGCDHYLGAAGKGEVADPGAEKLTDEELAILLLLGEHPFNPTALRCAAQLLSGDEIDPDRVARLARLERCERALAHIARAGAAHDEHDSAFWQALLNRLPARTPPADGALPHWTRFVSLTGVRRYFSPQMNSVWLRPRS